MLLFLLDSGVVVRVLSKHIWKDKALAPVAKEWMDAEGESLYIV